MSIARNVVYVVVEYEFDPPMTEEGLRQLGLALGPCVAVRRIVRLRSVLSDDGRRGYCELEAPDAETVREAYRSARVSFRSVWVARLFDGRPPTALTAGRPASAAPPAKV